MVSCHMSTAELLSLNSPNAFFLKNTAGNHQVNMAFIHGELAAAGTLNRNTGEELRHHCGTNRGVEGWRGGETERVGERNYVQECAVA